MNGRKTYEVVGYSMDGYFLCVDCHGPEEKCDTYPVGGERHEWHCEHSPVFLSDCRPEDYCDSCMSKWVTDPATRQAALMGNGARAPSWVYLDGEGPPPSRADEDWEDFFQGYLECALWCGIDPMDGSADHVDGDESDLSEQALKEMREDCEAFFREHVDTWSAGDHGLTDEQAGHDFYLSRNGHGAGFFDSGHENADELQKAARVYGTQGLYFGDDGKLYTHG